MCDSLLCNRKDRGCHSVAQVTLLCKPHDCARGADRHDNGICVYGAGTRRATVRKQLGVLPVAGRDGNIM